MQVILFFSECLWRYCQLNTQNTSWFKWVLWIIYCKWCAEQRSITLFKARYTSVPGIHRTRFNLRKCYWMIFCVLFCGIALSPSPIIRFKVWRTIIADLWLWLLLLCSNTEVFHCLWNGSERTDDLLLVMALGASHLNWSFCGLILLPQNVSAACFDCHSIETKTNETCSSS